MSKGCPEHSLMNLHKTEVYLPCLEIETWLMKNKGGIQNFTIPKNSLKRKHQCEIFLRRQTWAILPDATGSSLKS
jgi:hypothetical protein